jgi:tRNA (guanine37-N1)-methyltransferase
MGSLRNDLSVMFRPPVNRAMCVLDRSFFRKTCPLSAATVFDNSNISRVRGALSQSDDILSLPRLNPIQIAPLQGPLEELNPLSQTKDESKTRISSPRKCLLLRDGIKHNGSSTFFPELPGCDIDGSLADTKTWSPTINALVEEGTVGLGPYDLVLNYDYWTYSKKKDVTDFYFRDADTSFRRYHWVNSTRGRSH